MNKRSTLRIAVTGAVVVVTGMVLLWPAGSKGPMTVTATLPDAVVQGMGTVGSVLTPAPNNAEELATIDLSSALAAADDFATAGQDPEIAALALFSDRAAGGPDASELPARLVYVLVFDGLELYPFGEPGASTAGSDAAPVHHELVVLIDAVTGEFISATTYR